MENINIVKLNFFVKRNHFIGCTLELLSYHIFLFD
jgi:hypothetical protein